MRTVALMTIVAIVAALTATGADTLNAQGTDANLQAPASPLPQFEASIKRSQSNDGMMAVRADPQGRTISGMVLRQLIVQSYGIQPNQLIGGPDWLTTDRWDIQLRADGPVTPPQANLLMQKMLADRFKLGVHRETRELPVFELRLARSDGKPGPELKPAAVDCGAQGRGRVGAPPPPPAGAGPGAAAGRGPALGGGCMLMMTMGSVQVAGQPLTALTTFLSGQLGRPVIDKTGLSGAFDLKLSWTPDGAGRAGGGPPLNLPPGAPAPPPIDPNGPSIFTALQEQLGLKLEPSRGPVEVLVIDSVQHPTEN